MKKFIIAFVICLITIKFASSQNPLDLSYSNVDIHGNQFGGQNPYARPTPPSTTTVAPTTTKKPGFFGGIRNYFRGEKKPESTPAPPTTPAPVVTPKIPAPQSRPSATPGAPIPSPVTPILRPGVPQIPGGTPVMPGASQPPPVLPQRGSMPSPPPMPQRPTSQIGAITPTPGTIPSQTPTVPQRGSIPSPPPLPQRPTSQSGPIIPPVRPGSPQSPGSVAPPTPLGISTPGVSPSVPQRPGSPSSPWGQPPSTPSRSDFPPLPQPGRPTNLDFPPLPQRPGGASPPSPSLPPAWSTPRPSTPSQPGVSFIPTQPRPQSRPSTPPPVPPRSTPAHPGSPASSGSEIASDSEITTLMEALLTKDVNNPNKFVTVNTQGRTQSSAISDEAPQRLLTLDETAVFAIPTISKLRDLYNNYELDTMVNEYVTPNERREENDFVDAIMATSVMRHAMQFLQNKGLLTPDPKTHRDLVKTIWFNLYSRGGGRIGSSAFEHIFLAEIKNNTVSGLHNWIYFYEQEKAGKIDYKGYIKTLDIGNKGSVLKLRFTYNNINKPVNSMFIGFSPELEMAIYTVCFQLRPDKDCPISLDGKTFKMATHTFRYRGKNLIGSAYAEL